MGAMLDQREAFVLRAAELLHAYGTPAPRCEGMLRQLMTRLGVEGDVSVTPTALLFTLGDGGSCHSMLRRVEPGEVDLGRLVIIGDILRHLESGDIDLGTAALRLEELRKAPPRSPRWAVVLGFGAVSASSTIVFGGGLVESAVATTIGLLTGLLSILLVPRPRLAPVFEPVAAFVASASAYVLSRTIVPHADDVVTLASLIVLVPGLSFTVGMVELASRHWISGTARLAGAGVTFLTLAFGVALGRVAAARLLGAGEAPAAIPFEAPTWAVPAALVLASIGFTILFQARARELAVILGAGAVAMVGAKIGVAMLGPELGGFVGALAVGLFANAYSNLAGRPSLVATMPGILLLVPGSIGYRALDLFVAHDVTGGLQTAFATLLVAIALVGGLLIANAILPPRTSL
jgi:uncharacterized membrane protein YjjP (DUF1212 family)